MTLSQIIASGDLDDYQPGAPRRPAAWIDGAAIDREICEQSNCEACGAPAPEYRPFYSARLNSYRPFAVCRQCGTASEF